MSIAPLGQKALDERARWSDARDAEAQVEHFYRIQELAIQDAFGVPIRALCGHLNQPGEQRSDIVGTISVRPTSLDSYDCSMCIEVAATRGFGLVEAGGAA